MYSGLHIFNVPEKMPFCGTNLSPIISLTLPRPVFKVTFLDEYNSVDADGGTVTNTRWVSQLDDSESAILALTYKKSDNAGPHFTIRAVLNPLMSDDPEEEDHRFAIDLAVGSAGGHIISTSVVGQIDTQTPAYRIAPIRSPEAQSVFINFDETHISVVEPVTIPKDGLPSSRTVSCLDFDDGHGLLLIGSDAGQFCLVNFANALLPNESIYFELPTNDHAVEDISKVTLYLFSSSPRANSDPFKDPSGVRHSSLFLLSDAARIRK